MILKMSFSADICLENIITNDLLVGVILNFEVIICDLSDNRENTASTGPLWGFKISAVFFKVLCYIRYFVRE